MGLLSTIGFGVTVFTCVLTASDIQSTITIKHRLTKKRVTLTANLYERGVAVPLPRQSQDDLAYERSHVVLFLEDSLPSTPRTGVMQQENRQFVPNLLALPVGSTVSFPNLDPIFHNVFSLSGAKSFDLGNYPKGQTRSVTFTAPGLILVNCRLHANMTASILITPSSYASISDPDGKVILHDVPPGTHTVVAWHKAAGYFRRTVVVEPGKTATVDFFIPLDDGGSDPRSAHEGK